MTPRPLSTDSLHSTTVAMDGRAVMICGPSGSGKSDLALRLLDRGFALVSDDQTLVRRDGAQVIASAPDRIAGKIEVRGIGIVDVAAVQDVAVALIVDLASDIDRIPDDNRERMILGIALPIVTIDAMTASAPSKVAIALDRFGRPAG